MKFFKTRHWQILTVLAICFTISVYLNISYAQQNKKYENYLSEQIGSTLKPMGARITDAKIIVDKVNKNGTISRDDMNSLYSCYNTFCFGTQDLFHLYSEVKKSQYKPLKQAYYFRAYNDIDILNRQIQLMNEPIYKLTDSDKDFFKRIQKITNEYVNVFGTDYYNWNLSISGNKWVDTIKQIGLIGTKDF